MLTDHFSFDRMTVLQNHFCLTNIVKYFISKGQFITTTDYTHQHCNYITVIADYFKVSTSNVIRQKLYIKVSFAD